jgi:hypothetical protein
MQRAGLPETYAVHTGRRINPKDSTPEYGVQLYYSCAMPSVGEFSLGGGTGQVKSLGGYVMAAGSIHPDSGEAYELMTDAPVTPLPDVVRSLKTEHKSVEDDGQPITENRNIRLTSIAGKLRNAGLSAAALEVALLQVNADRCVPPLEEEEVKRIATNAAKWELPEPEPVAILGGSVPKEVDTSMDAEILPKGPRPVYPLEVWEGTVYGDFGKACSARNYIPQKFFIESLRTVVGAIVGEQLRCNVIGVHPRAFTICIAPAGAGKGTSNEFVHAFFGEVWDGLTRTSEEPLIWSDPKQYIWRGRGIGAQVASFSSSPGLMVAIEPRKLKKGETHDPLEAWKPIPRIITMAEEVRGLLANFANESTGAGLESVLCELFDRDSFTTTATKDRAPASGKLMYSLLGGITPEDWTSIFSKVESTGSGFQFRLNIVGTEEARRVGGLIKPDFEPLRRRLFPLIADLEKHALTIDPSDAALKRVEDWFISLELPEGISKSRLNIHAWRAALHLAWLKGHTRIELEDVEGGFKCAEYLGKMREWYAPPEGETRAARAEAAIRKVMRSRRRSTVRDLQAATSSKRISVDDWGKALKALERAGEIRVADEKTPKGRTRKVVILLRDED